MKMKDRKEIGNNIRYELKKGEHTFHQCRCNRRGCRSEMCWECWLEILEDEIPNFSLLGKFP